MSGAGMCNHKNALYCKRGILRAISSPTMAGPLLRSSVCGICFRLLRFLPLRVASRKPSALSFSRSYRGPVAAVKMVTDGVVIGYQLVEVGL